jgi:hypothetical protein
MIATKATAAMQRKDVRRALSLAGQLWVRDHRSWDSLQQGLRQAYRHAWQAADDSTSRRGAAVAL